MSRPLKCIRERFNDSLKFQNLQDLYGKPIKREWVARVVFLIQILLIFGCCCNHSSRDRWLKIYRLLNFNMLFQFLLTKFSKSELFSCLQKVDQVTNYCPFLTSWLHAGSHSTSTLFTGKNNGFPFLDIKYLKIPNLEEWDKFQYGNLVGNSLVGTCLTLPANLGFLWVFFKYPKISKHGNPLFFPCDSGLKNDNTHKPSGPG